jgi:protein-tyrosine-phosphatase
LLRKHPFKVLFVCTGNQCRSPMAQGILDVLLQKKKIQSIQADSAGTYALYGYSPSEEAVILSMEHGVDIADYRSKPISLELLEKSDLVLVMGRMHHAVIMQMAANAAGKVFLLKSFGRDSTDPDSTGEVSDPIGGDREEYARCFDELNREVERVFPLIKKMAGQKKSDA